MLADSNGLDPASGNPVAANGSRNYDVIIVGGGFAGISAARELSRAGYRTVILEARGQLGGRARSRKVLGTDVEMSLGGAYLRSSEAGAIAAGIRPHYAESWREVSRYGLGLHPTQPASTRVTLIGGQRLQGTLPLPSEEWPALESIAYAMSSALRGVDPSAPIDQQIGRGIDLSWADFLEPLDLPPLTADYVCTYARVMGQKDVTDFSIGIMAHQIMSFGNSILRRSLAPVYEIEGGPRALYDAIFADSTADLKLETPVTAIEQSANAVHVTTPDGGFTGRVCVVATPVTQWNRIVFDTPLSREKVEGSSMNLLNPANKIFALVKDAPINAAGFGNPEQSRGFVYTLPGKRVGEAQILMGMTYGGRVDATDREDVQRAFQAYFPGCEVLAVDSHDWNTDEFSQGAWIAPPPGYLSTYATSMRAPEGRLVFATGDISRHNLSSIAGAIESGTDAATFADAILEQGPTSTLQEPVGAARNGEDFQ
ncbi:flavin monoamine oxidase family protein [Nocardioides sp. AN3]